MKHKGRSAALMAAGILAGTALSGPAAQAVEQLIVQRAIQSMYVDGHSVTFEAYYINGANYVKLRDIGEAVVIETAQYHDINRQAQAAREALREQLNKEQRKYLLHLTDLQNTCIEEAMLCGFITGYRLAEGIRRELEEFPPFSILAEDEKRNL